jgi:hypothetical protein
VQIMPSPSIVCSLQNTRNNQVVFGRFRVEEEQRRGNQIRVKLEQICRVRREPAKRGGGAAGEGAGQKSGPNHENESEMKLKWLIEISGELIQTNYERKNEGKRERRRR